MKSVEDHASESIEFSIVMPSYNPGQYFAAAVESALKSMGPQDELIVQDSCSSDGTAEFIDGLASIDLRIKVTHEKDEGQSDALNRALARCQREFVVWLNADDVLDPNALDVLRDHLAKQPSADIVQGMHSILRADSSVIAAYDPPILSTTTLMKRGCYVFSGSIAFRRSLLLSIGGFARDLSYCMDLDLLFRVSEYPGVEISKISAPIGALRWHDASKSGGQGHRFLLEGMVVRRRYLRSPLDGLSTIFAALVQALALLTTKIRHTSFYASIRGRRP